MDWQWNESSHKDLQNGKSNIKKLKEEWLWQPANVGPGQSYGGHHKGMLFEDETYPCGFCAGKGEKPAGSKCPVCRGSGTASVEPPAVKCAFCKGGGAEKPRSNVTCTACKGKGVVHVEAPVETCSYCRGTGKEPGNKLVCGKCRGKGVVTVREEAEGKYSLKEEVDAFAEEKRPVGSASGSERDALRIIKELGRADGVTVARNMSPPVSTAYAGQLCGALVKKALLVRDGVVFSLTPDAQKVFSSD